MLEYNSLTFSDRSVYIRCSYIPPSSEFPKYLNHLSVNQTASNILSDKDQEVLGDFNIPGTYQKKNRISFPP